MRRILDVLVEPIVTKAPREGASFITSQSELGGIRGGCGGGGGGGPELVGFFGFGGRYAVLGDIDPLNKAPF